MVGSLSPQSLGARLRRAREARGLSQQQVAERLGLKNHQPVLRMESGQRDVSTVELAELARLYRRPLSFFVASEVSEAEEADYAVLFRAGGLADKDLAEVDRVVRRCEEFAFLTRVLNITAGTAASVHLDYTSPSERRQAATQGERIAADARRILGIDEGEAITDLPGLLEEQGIGVFAADLPEDVSGLCVGAKKTGRCIVVNANERATRNAFTAAHEFCHLLLGETAHICYQEEERDLVEVRANRFAGALLMPAAALEGFRRDQLGARWQELNPVHVVELQFHFKVSYQAVLVRLRRLDLISEAQYSRLERVPKEHLARLIGHIEENEMSRPAPFERRLRVLAIETYRLGRISRGRLAEILGLDFDETGELLGSLGIDRPAIPRRHNGQNPLLGAASR